MNLRCAVVGVGYLGRFHAQKYKMIEGVDLVGVVDPSESRRNEIGKELGVDSFAQPEELIGKVDAVTIAAPTPLHYELGQLFLGNGIHVLMEKPITVESAQARELCQLANQKKLKFQVGHVERFNTALLAAEEKLGQPLFIDCQRLAKFQPRGVDVNVVLDLMIHDLDVILSMVDSPIQSVSAVGTHVLTDHIDMANARIEFESGAVANVSASRVSMDNVRKFRAFQEDQYLTIDFGNGQVQLTSKTGHWTGDHVPLSSQSWSLKKSDGILAETNAFLTSIKEDKPCVVTGEDGTRALELAERILSDIKKRQ